MRDERPGDNKGQKDKREGGPLHNDGFKLGIPRVGQTRGWIAKASESQSDSETKRDEHIQAQGEDLFNSGGILIFIKEQNERLPRLCEPWIEFNPLDTTPIKIITCQPPRECKVFSCTLED